MNLKNNFLNIVNSWLISFNPTSEQKTLAQNRSEICNICTSKLYLDIFDTYICDECKCPLSKLIFSPQNKCKLNKWKN